MEVWKDMVGYEGHYQVSSLGKIKSLKKYFEDKDIIKKVTKDRRGYLRTNFWLNGKIKGYRIHRIVATAFIPNPENLPQVNHKDGNKENNAVSNLEWVSNLRNRQHAEEIGIRKIKLSRNDVLNIRDIFNKGSSLSEIADTYNLSKGHAYSIVTGRVWKHLNNTKKL